MEPLTLIPESKGKANARYINLEETNCIHLNNTRTKLRNRIMLDFDESTSEYIATLHYQDDEKPSIEYRIASSGEITVLIFESVITVYIKKNILYLIAADEIEIYQ